MNFLTSKKFQSITAVIGSVVVAMGTASTAQAVVLISTSGGQVGTLDPLSAAFTPLVTSSPDFTDIALSNNNQLFGNTLTQLYSIVLNSQQSSLIGDLGSNVNGMNALGFSTNNQLYGAGGSGVSAGFYTIDTTTGAASLVANIPGFNSSGDLAFDPVNNRFLATSLGTSSGASDILFSITPTGTATPIGNIGFSNVFGLAFEQGTLFGVTADGQEITINPSTGVGTFYKNVTGLNGQTVRGAATLPTAGPTRNTVPEPASNAGILAFATLAVTGMLVKRKQQLGEN